MHKPDGTAVFLRMAPLELYSADELYRLWHLRFTGGPTERPCITTTFNWVEPTAKRFVDPDHFLFAVRPDDPTYSLRANQLLQDPNQLSRLVNLAEAVIAYNYHDTNRSDEPIDGAPPTSMQYRVDILCAGRNYDKTGRPSKLNGFDFLKMVETDPTRCALPGGSYTGPY